MNKADYINPDYKPEFERSLGTIILRTSGDGLYLKDKVTFAAEIILQIDSKEEIERDANGKITFVYGHFEIHFSQPFAEGTHPYTDRAVEQAINTFLAMQGYVGKVSWSEYGRQSPFHGDFDADYTLFEEIIPEAFV